MPDPSIQAPKVSLEGSYEPKEFEQSLYSFWEKSGCFESQDESAPGQPAFSIMIPPPNVTGVLHLGHALTATIEDILIRWRRMCGDNTLWLPGMDHAGIATQAQVEKALKKEEGKSRHDIGRDAFLKRTWEWKEKHGGLIFQQLRRLGASCDWKRSRFTMDDGFYDAVRTVFVSLYQDGLIYRGEKIINWCTRCRTALSDLEVEPKERKGFLWHIRYKVVDAEGKVLQDGNKESLLTIATTRPETLLGDTAVAVHSKDERYKKYHGLRVQLPLLNRLIPIIVDDYVDPEFGTGALKVTPAHDFNDYELGLRHDLPFIDVMGKDGTILKEGGPYAGLDFKQARESIIKDLEAENLLAGKTEHKNQVGLCSRCDTVVEPVISKQWFVKIEPLAKPAIEAVRSGKIVFAPKTWEKTYFAWMENIRDWCISRQLWWGHQIPAWHCEDCSHVEVATEEPSQCSNCQSKKLKQDEDVLDTWFSSGLWSFATLGWPEKTKALATFYPNSILETGFDIIFFWVARMIMMGLHFMGDVPFRRVYLHAMVRDEKGEKMSKSRGNVIDPMEIIEHQGADPLRFTLAVMAGQGRDVKLSTDRIEGYRAFCNKLWNATKFLHLHVDKNNFNGANLDSTEKWVKENASKLSIESKWILCSLQEVIRDVAHGFENFELNVSSQAIYHFTWHELCDWFIEFSKTPLSGEENEKKETLYVLHYLLEQSLKLLHPIMPYLTEQLWLSLPWKAFQSHPSLMLQKFPQPESEFESKVFKNASKEVGETKAVVDSLRAFRGANRISPKKEFEVKVVPKNDSAWQIFEKFQSKFQTLAKVTGFRRVKSGEVLDDSGMVSVIPLSHPAVDLRIDLSHLVNVEEELARLKKELGRSNEDLNKVEKKLGNSNFAKRAPAEVVQKERTRKSELQQMISELTGSIARLEKLR